MFNGVLFQQSLQDLVKGVRAHRRDEDEYIRTKVAEIADECRGSDVMKKTTAVLKLTHVCSLRKRLLRTRIEFVLSLTRLCFIVRFLASAVANDGT